MLKTSKTKPNKQNTQTLCDPKSLLVAGSVGFRPLSFVTVAKRNESVSSKRKIYFHFCC